MKFSKKITALFIAVMMVVSAIPFTASAASDPYLTFTGTDSFSIKTNNSAKNWDGTLQYSTDANTWTTWNGTSQISSDNNVLYLRGTGNTLITGISTSECWVITTQGTVACSGDIRTLLDYDEPEYSDMDANCFAYLFNNCTSLTAAPELPATRLASNCYNNMFYGCTSLTMAPELPATSLASNCYYSMFNGCTSLTTAPELWATSLAPSCYSNMFEGCTSLTTAPELPATSLASGCYRSMFKDCTSLTTPSELWATTLTNSCYRSMFQGCTGIKLSTTQTAGYSVPYSIPKEGTGSMGSNALTNMFTGTGGTFTGTPTINTTYYIAAPAEPVASVNGVSYTSFADAVAASHAANEAVITPLVNLNDLEQPVYTMTPGEVLNVEYVSNYNVVPAVSDPDYDVVYPYTYEGGRYVFHCSTVLKGNVKYTGDFTNYVDRFYGGYTGTQKVLTDFTQSTSISFSSATKQYNVILDLGGNTVTFNQAANDLKSIYIGRGSTVTVTNGTIVFTTDDGFYVDGGTLNVDETATLIATGTHVPIVVKGTEFYDTTVNVEGTVEAADGYAIGGNGKAGYGGYEVNIKDGADVSSANNIAIYHPNTGDLNISGGTVSGTTAVYTKSGTTTITGGTLEATGAASDYQYSASGAAATGDAIVVDNCGFPGGTPSVSIEGGTITSANGEAVASHVKQDDANQTGSYEQVVDIVPSTSTAVFSSDVSDVAQTGYETVYDAQEGGYVVVTDDHTAAKIGNVKYDSLADAIAAAQDGDTITLVANSTGNGISIPKNKFPNGLTVNFNGFTYTCNENYAGSTGTQRQAFQLNEGNTITFKNGTIESEGARMLIQNYSDLTLDNMTLNHEGHADFSDKVPYALSNNNGTVVIKDTTINACDDGFAFDACRYATYTSVNVTVTGESVINGDVELSASGSDAKDGLSVNFAGGTLNGEIVLDATAETAMDNAPAKAYVQKASTFVAAPPEGYVWDANGKLVPSTAEDAYSITVEDNIDLNFYIETATSDVDHLVVTYSNPAKDDGSTITVTKPAVSLETYVDSTTNKEYKVYKVDLAPAQLKDNIRISVYEDSTNVQRVIETSVDEYCRTILSMDDAALGAKATELKGLAMSTLDYGKAAAEYFEYNDSAFAGVANQLVEPDLNDERLYVAPGSNSYSIPLTGVSYVATTVPELRFTIDSSISENYLTELNETIETNIGEAEFVKVVEGGQVRRMLQIKNIDITDFGKQIVVTAGGDTILTFVPLTWAKAAAGKSGTIGALGKSICNYYLNSVAYFGIKA